MISWLLPSYENKTHQVMTHQLRRQLTSILFQLLIQWNTILKNYQCKTLMLTPEGLPTSCSVVQPDNFNIPAVLNNLFGGESATSQAPQPLNFSNSIPLGATVLHKLKQKIWKNTYFDICLLLPNQQEDNFSVSVERGAINFLEQGKFQKFPISINQCTSAFLIFASIHIYKTPADAPHFLIYMYMIRDMGLTTKSDS